MDEDEIRERFAGLGPVRSRRMFGGRGLYLEGRIFAIEIGGDIYLKTDATTRPLFQAAGSRPFVYERAGRRPATTSYWLLPEIALDDPDEAARWGRLAVEAAQRSGSAPRWRPPDRRRVTGA